MIKKFPLNICRISIPDSTTLYSLFAEKTGQRSITISRAIMAWNLVLSGRFRSLNQWRTFVEVLLLEAFMIEKQSLRLSLLKPPM
nr:hypothetical protein [Tanacetum cinerariifolium]